ncbi:MAG: NADH-quinone oxidoreductase subunit J [Thermoleophilia bacterium]
MPEIGLQDFLLGLLGAIAVFSALYAVLTRYLLRSIVSLGAFLTAVAGEFYLLAADFVALIQIFVYVGGVVVLILFALMLSSVGERQPTAASDTGALAVVAAYGLGGWLLWAGWGTELPAPGEVPEETVGFLGRAFLNEQLLAFELVGIILLAAVVTALVMVREE